MTPRHPKQLSGYPSVEEGVTDVLLVVAEDGTMWWLKNPTKNKEWVRLPDLPAPSANVIDYERHERRG